EGLPTRAPVAASAPHAGAVGSVPGPARGRSEAAGLLLEDADELLADDPALGLGLGYAAQAGQEPLLGIHRHQRDLERVAEGVNDLLALVLSHQPVVHEHARELIS